MLFSSFSAVAVGLAAASVGATQGCGMKGLIIMSAIQRNLPPYVLYIIYGGHLSNKVQRGRSLAKYGVEDRNFLNHELNAPAALLDLLHQGCGKWPLL